MIDKKKINELVDLRTEYWRTTYGFKEGEERAFRATLRKYLQEHWNKECYPLMVEVFGKPVACAFLIFIENLPTAESPGIRAELHGVYTKPEYRRRGYATALLDAATSIAASRGALFVDLYALDSGKPVYEKYGFEPKEISWTEMRYEI